MESKESASHGEQHARASALLQSVVDAHEPGASRAAVDLYRLLLNSNDVASHLQLSGAQSLLQSTLTKTTNYHHGLYTYGCLVVLHEANAEVSASDVEKAAAFIHAPATSELVSLRVALTSEDPSVKDEQAAAEVIGLLAHANSELQAMLWEAKLVPELVRVSHRGSRDARGAAVTALSYFTDGARVVQAAADSNIISGLMETMYDGTPLHKERAASLIYTFIPDGKAPEGNLIHSIPDLIDLLKSSREHSIACAATVLTKLAKSVPFRDEIVAQHCVPILKELLQSSVEHRKHQARKVLEALGEVS